MKNINFAKTLMVALILIAGLVIVWLQKDALLESDNSHVREMKLRPAAPPEERSSLRERRTIDVEALRTKCRKGYYSDKLEDMWEQDLVVQSELLPGMILVGIAERNAVESGWLSGREYDEKRAPGVVLIEDVYVVVFWKKTNPYRKQSKAWALQVEVSAWNGEVVSGAVPGGGSQKIILRSDDGTWNEPWTDEQELRARKWGDLLGRLDDAATERGEIPENVGDAPDGVVSRAAAIAEAEKWAAKRAYDRAAPPIVSLIEGVYVVAFWKNNPEGVGPGSPLYDSRVLIDAETGNYLKMEITYR